MSSVSGDSFRHAPTRFDSQATKVDVEAQPTVEEEKMLASLSREQPPRISMDSRRTNPYMMVRRWSVRSGRLIRLFVRTGDGSVALPAGVLLLLYHLCLMCRCDFCCHNLPFAYICFSLGSLHGGVESRIDTMFR